MGCALVGLHGIHALAKFSPTGEIILASDNELGITQSIAGGFRDRFILESGVEFLDALECFGYSLAGGFEEILGLMLKMREAGIGRVLFFGHDELLSGSACVRSIRRKVVRY